MPCRSLTSRRARWSQLTPTRAGADDAVRSVLPDAPDQLAPSAGVLAALVWSLDNLLCALPGCRVGAVTAAPDRRRTTAPRRWRAGWTFVSCPMKASSSIRSGS
jgi:hypothetical protein